MLENLSHNEKAFKKIKELIFATVERLEYGKVNLELIIHEKKIAKLNLYGKKTIK